MAYFSTVQEKKQQPHSFCNHRNIRPILGNRWMRYMTSEHTDSLLRRERYMYMLLKTVLNSLGANLLPSTLINSTRQTLILRSSRSMLIRTKFTVFHFIPYKRAKCTLNLTKSFNTFHFVDICRFKASLLTLPTEPKSSLPLSVTAITSSNLDAKVKGQCRAFCVQDWPFDGTSWVHSAQNLNSFCIYLHQKFHPHPSTNSWVISSSNETINERKRPKHNLSPLTTVMYTD